MIIQTRKYDEMDEVNVMTKTVAVKKDKLKGIFDTASLKLSEPTRTVL